MRRLNNELVTENVKLVYFIYEKLSKNEITVRYKDDIVSEGMIGLIKAAKNFEPDKGYKFATYAACCIRNQMLMFLRKLNRQVPYEISLTTVVGKDKDGGELYLMDTLEADSGNPEDGIERLIFDEFISAQNEKDRTIVAMIRKGHKQKDIGDKIGMKQSTVSRRIARLKKKYRNNV